MKEVPVVLQLALRHTIDDPRACHRIAAALADRYRVELIAEDAETGVKEPGVTCHVHRNGGFSDFFTVLPLIRQIRPDVIHCHDPVSFVVGVIAKLFLRRCKLIFDVHEMYETYDTSGMPYLQKLFLDVFNKVFVPVFGRFTDAFILVIPEQKERYRRFGKPLEIIYNFPRLDQFINHAASHGETKKDYLLIYEGGIHHDRGAIEYLKILNRLKDDHPDARLVFVGPATEETFDQIRRYTDEYDLGDRVTITGRVSHHEVIGYIYASKIGLNFLVSTPNKDNSVQTKAFEYMACGVPVIGTKTSIHFDEMVVQEGCGLSVRFDDTEEAVAAIRTILTDYDRFSSHCHDKIGSYSWEHEAVKLHAFYDQMLADGRGDL